MKIRMLQSSSYQKPFLGENGKPLKKKVLWQGTEMEVVATETIYVYGGDIVDVPDAVAKAFIEAKIAVKPNVTVDEDVIEDIVTTQTADEEAAKKAAEEAAKQAMA